MYGLLVIPTYLEKDNWLTILCYFQQIFLDLLSSAYVEAIFHLLLLVKKDSFDT